MLARSNTALTLDLACGFGRNSVLLAAHGCDVICVDRDLKRLHRLDITKSEFLARSPLQRPAGNLATVCADITEQSWPFVENSFGTIVSVHFMCLTLMPYLLRSLRVGGHIYIETFGGQGANYLSLPRPGETKAALGDRIDLLFYQERVASRKNQDAVTVKALGRKN